MRCDVFIAPSYLFSTSTAPTALEVCCWIDHSAGAGLPSPHYVCRSRQIQTFIVLGVICCFPLPGGSFLSLRNPRKKTDRCIANTHELGISSMDAVGLCGKGVSLLDKRFILSWDRLRVELRGSGVCSEGSGEWQSTTKALSCY